MSISGTTLRLSGMVSGLDTDSIVENLMEASKLINFPQNILWLNNRKNIPTIKLYKGNSLTVISLSLPCKLIYNPLIAKWLFT